MEFIVYTFSEMIRGELSYFQLSPSRFCNEAVITGLIQAQMRAREMLAYLGIITDDKTLSGERLKQEFTEEQQKQNSYIFLVCQDYLPDSEIKIEKLTREFMQEMSSQQVDEEEGTETEDNADHRHKRNLDIDIDLENNTKLEYISKDDRKFEKVRNNPITCKHLCISVLDSANVWCE